MTRSLYSCTCIALGKAFLLALVLGAGTAAYISDATALALGDIEVKSHLSEPFLGYVTLKAEQGTISDACFSTEGKPSGSSDGIPYLQGIKVVMEEAKNGKRLTLTTTRAVNEPILRIVLVAACSGGKISKEYSVLLDPIPRAKTTVALPAAAIAVAGKEAPVPIATKKAESGSEWTVKPGETLSGIAHDLFPWNTAKQKKMLKAIIAANPKIVNPLKPGDLISGTVLYIPVLPQAEATDTRNTGSASAKPLKAAKSPSPGPTKHMEAKPSTDEKYQVRLASGETPAKGADKNSPQQQVKELITSTDDQTASVLALTNQVSRLESQLAQLQTQLGKLNKQLALARPLPPSPAKTKQDNVLAPTALVLISLLLGALFTGVVMYFRGRLIPKRFRTSPPDETEAPYRTTPRDKNTLPPPATRRQESAPATRPDEDDSRNIAHLDANAISVAFGGSILDEVNLYLSSGHTSKAIAHLEEHLNENQEDIQAWIKLFELYAAQGATASFAALRPAFTQTFSEDFDAREKIRQIGRALDPDNPLYFAEEEKENLDFDRPEAKIPMEKASRSGIAPAIETENEAAAPPPLPDPAPVEPVMPEAPVAEPEPDDTLLLEIPLEFDLEVQEKTENEDVDLTSVPPSSANEKTEAPPLELPPLEFTLNPVEGESAVAEPASSHAGKKTTLDALPELLDEPDLPPLELPKN